MFGLDQQIALAVSDVDCDDGWIGDARRLDFARRIHGGHEPVRRGRGGGDSVPSEQFKLVAVDGVDDLDPSTALEGGECYLSPGIDVGFELQVGTVHLLPSTGTHRVCPVGGIAVLVMIRLVTTPR